VREGRRQGGREGETGKGMHAFLIFEKRAQASFSSRQQQQLTNEKGKKDEVGRGSKDRTKGKGTGKGGREGGREGRTMTHTHTTTNKKQQKK